MEEKHMKKLILLLLVFVTPATALAEEIRVTVKGMVCSFCAQGIKKNFSKLDAVQSVDPDLENKIVTIKTKEGATLQDENIKNIITEAGYEVANIERGH